MMPRWVPDTEAVRNGRPAVLGTSDRVDGDAAVPPAGRRRGQPVERSGAAMRGGFVSHRNSPAARESFRGLDSTGRDVRRRRRLRSRGRSGASIELAEGGSPGRAPTRMRLNRAGCGECPRAMMKAHAVAFRSVGMIRDIAWSAAARTGLPRWFRRRHPAAIPVGRTNNRRPRAVSVRSADRAPVTPRW